MNQLTKQIKSIILDAIKSMPMYSGYGYSEHGEIEIPIGSNTLILKREVVYSDRTREEVVTDEESYIVRDVEYDNTTYTLIDAEGQEIITETEMRN